MTDPLTPRPAANGSLDDLLEHADWIQGLARSLVRDPATADDLVQETWSAALEHPLGRPRASSARPWLATVMRNVWRSRRRADGRREARERDAAASEALPPESEMLERMDRQRALLEQVIALDEPYRATVILRYYEDLSTAEIAQRTGEPHERVRWRLRRAHELLRERLRREHGAGWGTWCALLLPLGERAARAARPALPQAATSAASTTVTAGVLLMNAKQLAAVAAVVAAITYWVAHSPEAAAPRDAAPASALAAPALHAVGPAPSDVERPALVGPLPAGFARAPLAAEPPPASAAPTTATLRGRVLAEEDGTPLAGARIVLLDDDERPARRLDESVLEALSDASGAFELASTPPDDYHLSCRLTGRAPTLLRGVRVAEAERELDVTLSHGALLDVAVTEAATGRPVAGAEVLAIAGNGRSFSILSTAGVEYHGVAGTTDAGGRARIAGVARGENQLVVRADGFANWKGELRVRGDALGAEVALLRGGTLRGRVSRDDGQDVSGTHVFLEPRRYSERLSVYDLAVNGVAVAADGGFAVPRVPAGEHYVVALAPDGATGFHMDGGGALAPVVLVEDQQTWLDLPIPVPARCAGRVLDRDGAGIEGASLSISWGDFKPADTGFFPLHPVQGAKESTHQTVRTDAEGRFRIECVRVSYEPLSIRVRAPGYQPAELELVARPGEVLEREVVLEPLASAISGRLATADGAGLPGVTVGAWGWSGDERGDLFLAQSQDDGTFSIEVPAHPERFEVWPILRDHDAHVSSPERRPHERAGARDLHFELRPKHFVEGLVVDERGAPVPGFAISLDEPGQQLPQVLRDVDLGGGRFRFPLDERFARATFTAPGFCSERRERFDPSAHVRVVLLRAPDLHGRVLAPDGSGLCGALVCLATLDGLAYPVHSRHAPVARTDDEGRFLLHGVPAVPGAMLLVAPEARGLPPLVRFALDGAHGGEVLVRLAAPVEVVVETAHALVLAIDASGWPLHPEVEPILGALRKPDADAFGAVSGGRTSLWLTPGDYHLLAFAADGTAAASAPLQVRAGAALAASVP